MNECYSIGSNPSYPVNQDVPDAMSKIFES